MIYGLDLLGAAMFEDVAVREFPRGWALGVFAVEFGDAFPVVKRIVESGRCPHVRVQLTWSRRGHVYDDTHFDIAKREAARYERLAKKHPRVRFELSTFCEHNLDNPDRYHDVIARIAPHCTIVNSPYQGAFSKKYKNEVHGSKLPPKGKYNFSFDGTGCVDADVALFRKRHKRSDVFFFWTYQFNGKRNGSVVGHDGKPLPYIPPQQRIYWPNEELIDSVIYLKNKVGKTRTAKNVLYKSHADQGEGDPDITGRECKPVIITPKSYDRIELVARNGQVIAVTDAGQPFQDGRFRHYCKQWGYQLAEKALRIQKTSAVVRLRANGRIIGTVNPAFREGDYRD